MLNLWFGRKDGVKYTTRQYFDHAVEAKWFLEPFIIRTVEDIDRNEMKLKRDDTGSVVGAVTYSQAFEMGIAPQQLSGGA